jgi:hypothetical protein
LDWFDALYKVYVSALLGVIGVVAAVNVIGGHTVAPASLPGIRSHGPSVVGLVVSALVLLSARSGGRGGPLGVEHADLRYLFLAPVPRSAVVRPMAVRYLQTRLLAGCVGGAATGLVVMHRLPGAAAAWIASGVVVGGAASMLGTGTAMVMSGLRVPRGVASVIGVVVVAWSSLDVARHAPTSPLTVLGAVALRPVRPSPLAASAAVIAAVIVLAAIGSAVAPGVSVEAAERRSKLVGELRFAATMRDFRTALVLQRQLSQDEPRRRPWMRLPGVGVPRSTVSRRAWRGVLRWPLTRYGRIVVAGAVAGVAAAGAVTTKPLLVIAFVAIWVAALDAVEPLAQEVDHPTLPDVHPVEVGRLYVRHLVVPSIVMAAPAAVGVVTGAITGHVHAPVTVLALIVVAVSATSVCGAAVTVVKGPPPLFDPLNLFLPPEVAGMRQLEQLAWPIVLSGSSLAGIAALAARPSVGSSGHVAPAAVAGLVIGVSALVVGGTTVWLLSRSRPLSNLLIARMGGPG